MLQPGNRVSYWRVERELGRGGMASVYAVSHTRFGKRAALKLAHRSILGPDFTPATFLREARIVHIVDHPGMPDVFATGTYDGRPYLAMERLTGETLGQLHDAGLLTRLAAVEYLLELCEVIAAAHQAGVVHRDLKLDNVFVQSTPGVGGRRVKLLDWGVARILGEDDPMKGMIAGTLTYVAPEQITGEEITQAADIYSLAVLCYHVLLGEPPFQATSDLDLVKKHLHGTPPSPQLMWPEIPQELAMLLTAMLAKEAAERPTIDEVARVLELTRERLEPKPVRRRWYESLPLRPPIDVLGRAMPLAFGTSRRARVVGAMVAAGLAVVGVLSMISA
ncbi:MAG TPA: serine/threonine-protein kinase [Kofleriaceae bacterium]|nr:serine/threonine-protein kinase [Kofleriaceae bacterium]